MMEPMDEMEAVQRAQRQLERNESVGLGFVAIDLEDLRAILARAQRPHD
jgi:hypothetical protein